MKKIIGLLFSILASTCLFAQSAEKATSDIPSQTEAIEKAIKTLQKLKVSGYIQAQYQYGEKNASLKVGTPNTNTNNSFDRFGICRGRIKFTYQENIATGVFQLDITEKGIGIKDAYLNIKDPWIGTCGIKAGIFDRPFGNEISYSSSRRESPERSTIYPPLFPDERDLGVMLTLQAPEKSPINFLKLETGLFAGNGIKPETDNRKDFITHLTAQKNIGNNIKLGLGVSYYNGGVYKQTDNVFTLVNKTFIIDSNNTVGSFAKREYIGIDGQFSIKTPLGTTQLRAEYLFGTQPAVQNNSKSPNYSTIPTSTSNPAAADMYIRNFNGGYIILVQDIGKLPLAAVFKYDWYNPNTKVTGNEIGLNGTTKTDLAQSTLGFGGLWNINNSLRLLAFYEINQYEKSNNELTYNNYLGNVFTLRLQYKF